MSLTITYSDPRGIYEPAALVSLGSNLRFGTLGLTMSAGAGDTAVSTAELEDPGGSYDFVGLRALDFRETSAPSNNRVIGRFVSQDREVGRSAEQGLLTGTDRLWSIDLTDFNWHLGARILVDSDANRPAETSGDRLRWLLTSAAHISLNDYGHVTYPSANMDANDYRGMRAADVLVDCAVEEQYNFWVRFNEAHGRPELFFMDPNGSSYASAVAISNLLADVDSVTTFAPYRDAKLRRSPTRIAYGVYVPFDGGNVYVRKDVTGDQYGLQDQTAPSATIHTAAKATRVATAFLNANDSETDVITVAIKVPAAQVNDIIEGQRLAVKFTHLPGYESGRWTRVTQRSVIQEEQGGGQYYLLDLTLVPCGGAGTVPTIPPPGAPGDFTGDAFAGLQRTTAYSSIGYLPAFAGSYNTGENVGGWGEQEESGPLHVVESAAPWRSIRTDEAITVRIHARGEGANVFFPAQIRELSITVNGVVVGTDSQSTGTGFVGWIREVDLRDYHLEAGDVVSVTGTATDEWGNAGVNHTFLLVGRGTYLGVTTPSDPTPPGWSGP